LRRTPIKALSALTLTDVPTIESPRVDPQEKLKLNSNDTDMAAAAAVRAVLVSLADEKEHHAAVASFSDPRRWKHRGRGRVRLVGEARYAAAHPADQDARRATVKQQTNVTPSANVNALQLAPAQCIHKMKPIYLVREAIASLHPKTRA
jgi:hypothetical protein